ncbi:hypothetical protein NMY22_g2724 [Coprinellus aureogranulatus]|nr:hypothetical protein NMY22_g2724 [Coprinellus aureogranulatus]
MVSVVWLVLGVLIVAVKADDKPCTVHGKGKYFDLTALKSSKDYHVTGTDDDLFPINMCQGVRTETYGIKDGAIKDEEVAAFIRRDHGDFVLGKVNTTLGIYDGRPRLVLSEGSKCKSSNGDALDIRASTIVDFVCDPGVFGPGQPRLVAQLPPGKADAACAFVIEWKTHYACPIGEGGFIWNLFVFLAVAFLSLLAAYTVLGTLYNRYVLQLRGFDQIPQFSLESMKYHTSEAIDWLKDIAATLDIPGNHPYERARNPPNPQSRRHGGMAVETVSNLITQELKALGPLLRLPAGKDVDADELTGLGLAEMRDIMKAKAPVFWKILNDVLTIDTAAESKDPDQIIITIISVAAYHRSHHSNRLQKLLAVYLKFRGVSAKGFDTLHALGLVMSHKWACELVGSMSEQALKEVIELIELFPWVASYDNVNIPFRVFSQRLENQKDAGAGTAATIYIKRDAEQLSEHINSLLKEQRNEGIKDPLTEETILELERGSYPLIQNAMEYIVLRMLLDSPEFDLASYEHRSSPYLNRPPALDALPTGPEHATLQYLLGTVDIPEASYEDNSRLVDEWFRQLGFDTKEKRVKLAMQKIVTWVGDQLTVDRLRHLFTRRADDDNSFERMDYSVFIFGWLHLQMALVNSIHKQYFGTTHGRGLRQAFELLNKKKLNTPRTQGPFHHDVVEAVYTVLEAHIREDWLRVGNVESLSELRNCDASRLKELAAELVETGASSAAMDRISRSDHPDELRKQIIMFCRDSLQYVVLDEAIKEGDVGMMEAMLPTLFFRFVGGGNSKYATEVLELMQGLYKEWPEEVA